MDIHNYLIIAWYLLQFVTMGFAVAQGHMTYTVGGYFVNLLVYAGLAFSIFITGDPGSWQAIALMSWWVFNAAYGPTKIGDTDYFDDAPAGLYIFIMFLISGTLMLLGANIPSGA